MRYKSGQSSRSSNLGILEDQISPDHYIRLLDEFIELAVQEDEDSYTSKGRSSFGQLPYGARSLLKLYVYGYYNRITSSRRLETEAGRNIELIWLLEGLRPSYKTIADYRRDHGHSIRLLLQQFSSFLQDNNYVEGKQVTVDSIRLKANTSRNGWSVKKIEGRLKQIDKQLNEYLKSLDLNDQGELRLENLVRLEKEEQEAVDRIAQLQEEIEDLLKKKSS